MIDAAMVREGLIDRLVPVFGAAKNADGIASALVQRVPAHATIEALGRLAEKLIETRKAKGFPSASELIEAVKGIPAPTAKGAAGDKPRFGQAIEQERARALAEAEERARRFLRAGDLARRAVAERWAPGLFKFAVDNGRAPDLAEERVLIAEARRNDAIARENASVLDGGLVRLRELMHWRAAQDLGIEVPRPAALEFRPRRGTRFTRNYQAPPPEPKTYAAADLAPSPALARQMSGTASVAGDDG